MFESEHILFLVTVSEGLRGGSVVFRNFVKSVTAWALTAQGDVVAPGELLREVEGEVLHRPLHVLVEEGGAEEEEGGVAVDRPQLLVHRHQLVPLEYWLDGGEEWFPGGARGDQEVGPVAGGGAGGQEPDPVAQCLLVH